ncbi:MAG TPA: PQQ-binding-like beta-propeller repeat protein [Nannocystis sp.]|jgi:hypothetical protein
MIREALLPLVLLAACDDASGPPATTGEESSSTGSGDETSTGTGGEDIDGPACASARWLLVEPRSDDISAIAVDSRGHVRFAAPIVPNEYRIVDIDAAGAIAADPRFDSEAALVRFAGVTPDNGILVRFSDRGETDPRSWLRKFDVAGAQVWQTDLGPYPDANLGATFAAPDGSTIVGVQVVSAALYTIRKYDPAGALVWEVPVSDAYLFPNSINAAGFIAAAQPFSPRLMVLRPDGSTLWDLAFDVPGFDRARIDVAGNIVATSSDGNLMRFSADGALLWEKTPADLPVALSSISDWTINQSGEIAIIGTSKATHRDTAFKLSPAGELASTVTCERVFISQVVLDEAGALYLGGSHFRNGAYDAVMAAF